MVNGEKFQSQAVTCDLDEYSVTAVDKPQLNYNNIFAKFRLVSQLDLVFGLHRHSQNTGRETVVDVVEYIEHEDYDETGEIENDIALLRLEHAISYTPDIKPACKPDPTPGRYDFEVATASGWGATRKSRKTFISTNVIQ